MYTLYEGPEYVNQKMFIKINLATGDIIVIYDADLTVPIKIFEANILNTSTSIS